jgi:hypothetical protein
LTRLQDLLISDIAHTGVDNRGELASLISTFAQGVFKDHLREMLAESADRSISSRLDSITEAFRFFLSGAQDPTTGYWGAWYIVDGKIHKTSDLSMTYHVIAYTKGRVEHWTQIIATTGAIESDPYPYGWRHNGRFNNHNFYDVSKIYKFGWPHMSQAERFKIGRQIQSMVDWSLSNTLGADDTFAHEPTFRIPWPMSITSASPSWTSWGIESRVFRPVQRPLLSWQPPIPISMPPFGGASWLLLRSAISCGPPRRLYL